MKNNFYLDLNLDRIIYLNKVLFLVFCAMMKLCIAITDWEDLGMRQVLAQRSASISELKKNPTALLNEAEGDPIVILNHNVPSAYLVPVDTYEAMVEMLDDYELGRIVQKRLDDGDGVVDVDIDDL